MTTINKCPVCEVVLKGRADKKYCSAKCKSIKQYETKQQQERFYLQVDRQLKINRKILKGHNRKGYTTIRKAELLQAGFDPNFFTHTWKNSKGDVYLFVYDYGFLDLAKSEKPKYLIVKWQGYMGKPG